jgi:hypothetical protein
MDIDPKNPAPRHSASISAEPIALSEKQNDLCTRLDGFYAASNKGGTRPSDMFRGALYAIRLSHRTTNPDWMAQAAHSLRDVLYPFYGRGALIKGENAFVQYGAAGNIDALTKDVRTYFGFLTSVAHHNWDQARRNQIAKAVNTSGMRPEPEVFEEIVSGFENVLYRVLRRQLDAHAEIDRFIAQSLNDIPLLRDLLGVNFDARRYFFSAADDRLFDWLLDAGFLKPVSKVPPEASGTPELDYLVKVAAARPDKVIDLMLATPISANSALEVVDRFLWICQDLPADQLARIVPKLRDEKWTALVARLNRSSFGYQRMFRALREANGDEGVLALAEAVLAIRAKEEAESARGELLFNPFYVHDLEYTKVFESVAAVGDTSAELALGVATHVFSEVVRLGGASEHPPFAMSERFSLYDKDLFTIEIGDRQHATHRDNLEDLAALAVLLARRSIGKHCGNAQEARRLFETYIAPMPDSRSTWALRLVVMTLCPSVFASELRAAFSRIFDHTEPTLLTAGAEYYRSLQIAFPALTQEDRADYISRVFTHFASETSEPLAKNIGWKILSSVYSSLGDDERELAAHTCGKPLDPNFSAGPAIGRSQGGWVNPKGPVDLDTISRMSISEIVDRLKKEWSPKRLREQAVPGDFLNPLNAEGMGRLLKADFRRRPAAYLDCAEQFFDRDTLHPQHTYSFLSGIREAIREEKKLGVANWSGLMRLMTRIATSGSIQPFDRVQDDRYSLDIWIAGWEAVHKAMADALEDLLRGTDGAAIMDVEEHRGELLSIISYLIGHADPEAAEEQKGESGSDPFTNAINSVRGEAFQALIWLAYRDASSFPEDASSRVRTPLKAVYEKCLKAESTMAVMFLSGYYLLFMFEYDRAWMAGLLPELFPLDPDKKDLYLAAWEGYLSNKLHPDLFASLEGEYQRAMVLSPAEYTKRRYHTELDEGLATHLALAFVHDASFSIGSPLFDQFWRTDRTDRHGRFVAFIGRYCVLREDADDWATTNNIDVQKIMAFWDWTLVNCQDENTLAAFGFWMKVEAEIFDPLWLAQHIRATMEKTKGAVDWQFGVMQSLRALVSIAPEDVMQTLRLHLYVGRVDDPSNAGWIYVDDNLVAMFKALYASALTKDGITKLINDLLPLRNGQFWRLKEAFAK